MRPMRHMRCRCVVDANPLAYAFAPTTNLPGQKFAMLEIKCLLVRLLLEYRLQTLTRLEDLTIVTDLTLRTKHPIRVRFHRRNDNQK